MGHVYYEVRWPYKKVTTQQNGRGSLYSVYM